MKPVEIHLADFKTEEAVDVLEVDACMVATGRVPYTSGLGLGELKLETRGPVPEFCGDATAASS